MRDYKQMQEIRKLREQAENDTAPTETEENKKYEHRSPGFAGWMAYIREYYKWPIIFGIVIVVGIIFGISQVAKTANPDLAMMYVGPFYLSPTEQDKLEASVASLSGDKAGDYNGDGEFRMSFLDLTVTHLTTSDGVQYTYDEQNNTLTRFQTELRAGDALIYFLEPYYYRMALADDILVPLSELGIDTSASPDGYGFHIGDLDCHELAGFERMPAEAMVCLRRSPVNDDLSYGRTVESWEYHRELFLSLVTYHSEDRVLDTETPADVTLFYAGAQPVYKSYRLPIERLLSQLAEDANGDGKRKGGLHAITKSGSDATWAVASKAIRTELITGDSCLLLLDEESYLYAKEHDLLEALPEELKNEKGATDGLAFKLSELELYHTEGFHELGAASYLCLRKKPASEAESYGRTAKEYENAKQLFARLATYTP